MANGHDNLTDGGFVRTIRRFATPTMDKVAKRWSDERDAEAFDHYDIGGNNTSKQRLPKVFPSIDEAAAHFRKLGALYESSGGDRQRSREKMGVADIAEFIVEHAHFTAYSDGAVKTLYIYDYDTGVYVDPGKAGGALDVFIVALTRHTSKNTRAAVIDTILANTASLMKYNPLPPHKVAFGNGIYNLITGTFEDFSPVWTTFNKIDTPYVPEAVVANKELFGDVDFDAMVSSFAKGNPERIRLVEEVCKAVVVGFTKKPASVFVVGEGGDGKSTFFEKMLGSAIGHRNVAPLGLGDLNKDDKLLGCESMKMILGTDNENNVYISDDTRFKQLATHDRIMVSRKYLDARSLSITGMMVQLCNTFPRFHSANNSIVRRIVPIRAENQYVSDGTNDESIDSIVAHPEFSKHVIAAILDKPYRADFNPCDMDMLEESATVNDILGQFVETLAITGVLDETTTALPSSHLYAAYLDWMEDNASKDKPFASRTFTTRIAKYLDKFGFRLSTDKPIRPGSGMIASRYTPSCFGDLIDGENLRSTVDGNRASLFFFREQAVSPDEVSLRTIAGRVDVECSVYEYLGLEIEIYNSMTAEEKRRYEEECKQALRNASANPAASSDGAGEQSADDGLLEGPHIPVNASVAFRQKDLAKLRRLGIWLKAVSEGRVEDGPALISSMDKLADHIIKAVEGIGDPGFALSVSNMRSVTDPRRAASIAGEAVDAMVAIIEGEKSGKHV